MALETGNFIDDLVASNPLGTDDQSLGDDHIRLIKTLLKATFKGATRAFQFSAAGAVKVSAYTIVLTDENSLIRGNVSSGDFTFTLPLGSTVFGGYKVTVMKSDSSTNTLTVDGSGAETINGASSDTLTVQYAATTYMWDGSEWKIYATGIITKLGAALDTNSFSINESKGADVIAATETDIFGNGDGNTLHITGDAQIDDFTNASSAGQWRKLIFDGTPVVTSGSGITVFGGTRTAVAGDMLMVFADTVSAFDAYWVLADGTNVSGKLARGYINGLITSVGTDTDHDVDIAAGECRNDGDTADIILSSGLTKQIDSAWNVGDDAGGLDTGAVAIDTWYYLWMIRRSDTGNVDVLFSASPTAPTMPTDYDQKRLIAFVLTDGSANINGFIQNDNEWLWSTIAEDASFSSSTSASNVTLSVPIGFEVQAKINVVLNTGGTNGEMRIYSPLQSDVSITAANANLQLTTTVVRASIATYIRTNTSSQIRARSNTAINNSEVSTEGWSINRSTL